MTIKNKLQQKLHHYLEFYTIRNCSLLLSVSTGIDSMVLLHATMDIIRQYNLNIAVLHFNHGLRKESDNEESYIQTFCDTNSIPCHIVKLDVQSYMDENRCSLEMAAHDLRYQHYKKYLAEHNYDYIATAHHQDDVLETIFMKLGKSSSREGLQGLSPFRPHFIKPFYYVTKEEIQTFQKEHEITFFEDLSNLDTQIERNFWRHEIIPTIEEYYGKGFGKGVLNSIENIGWKQSDFDLLKQEMDSLDLKSGIVEIPVKKLKSYFSDFRKRFMDELLSKLCHEEVRLTQEQVYTLDRLLDATTGKKIIDIPQIEISKQFDKIRINTIFKDPSLNVEIEPGTIIQIGEKQLQTSFVPTFIQSEQSTIEMIDFDRVIGDMHIRNVESFDKFKPLGLSGEQKVNRLLKAKKVAQQDRETKLVLCDEKGIVWLIGHRIADRVKVTDKTKKIFKMELLDATRD